MVGACKAGVRSAVPRSRLEAVGDLCQPRRSPPGLETSSSVAPAASHVGKASQAGCHTERLASHRGRASGRVGGQHHLVFGRRTPTDQSAHGPKACSGVGQVRVRPGAAACGQAQTWGPAATTRRLGGHPQSSEPV